MTYTLKFDASGATDNALVGGKGANLGRLTQTGFRVPPGFTVTTQAYEFYIGSTGLADKIKAALARVDFADAATLESGSATIRELIDHTPLSATITEAIDAAYRVLGSDSYVAVRSSGTSEDSAEVSFAGLHDTLLDIRGAALHDAIRVCWASLWTTRAMAYRREKNLRHEDARLAVVVQQMVESDVAGVLFTANPLSTDTNELVINASWGLGESVVSGAVTPDTYIVKANTITIRSKTIGLKETRIHRDPAKSSGTITEPVIERDRARLSLSDEEAKALCVLGLQVQAHYGGFPQDIEWALKDDGFYLLQSRPITGVAFSWDDDVDDWQRVPDRSDGIWSRAMADQLWTGGITPLMYSWRGQSWTVAHEHSMREMNYLDLASVRYWKYYKGTAYYNCALEKQLLERNCPPPFRGAFMDNIPPDWRDEVLNKPFSYFQYARLCLRLEFLGPRVYEGFRILNEKWPKKMRADADNFPPGQLQRFSDVELKRHIEQRIVDEDDYNRDIWSWLFFNIRDIMSLLPLLVRKWYDANDPTAYQTLITGSPQPTETVKCNRMLWGLSETIRRSPLLLQVFRENRDGAFFKACEASAEGRGFLEQYRQFLALYGHRGHADRDVYFPRRCEDPAIDYVALGMMLSTPESIDPEVKEKENNRKREEFTARVIEKIRSGPFGFIRAELFKVVLDFAVRWSMTRDNERNFIDYHTSAIRNGFLEVARRLVERKTFESVDDVWFLSKLELYAMLDGRPMTPLIRAKINARRRNFEKMLRREADAKPFLQNYQTIDLEAAGHIADGVLRGIGTARGTVTATARVVRELKDIGTVNPGEILIVNSTDPGWTPVFHIIGGIVLETGGLLAHGSCLAREYGLPAVQLPNALRLVPDGATITVNGDLGTVAVEVSGSVN